MMTQEEIRCAEIREALLDRGLYVDGETGPGDTWRLSPEPFYLSADQIQFFETLGGVLLAFYTALNRLYQDSVKGRAPDWAAAYLDMGKPSGLLDLARMNRFKSHLPGIIRPDVLLTATGFAITELDSVPGGFGRTAGLMELYARSGASMVGGEEGGIAGLFYRMLEAAAGKPGCTAAIVVSDEAGGYRAEMQHLARVLRDQGRAVFVRHPKDLVFREEGLCVEENGREIRLDVVYRFFELFDLKNIPKSELIAYAMKKGRVCVTPPFKPYLEEKLSLALLHHPVLAGFWEKALGAETFALLSHLIPKTWILDNRPLPPHAVIPGFSRDGRAVGGWQTLYDRTQKERELVVKISGFSPLAWGGRGVVVGHDVPAETWNTTIADRLRRFSGEPSVLQVFHKAKRVKASYWDPAANSLREMPSRVRLTPYYFTMDNKAHLGGILATLCPQDKKKIHGMADAIMVPCAAACKDAAPGFESNAIK
ncbi:MAG: hypothetical protein ACE5ER_03535 [Nitrospinaceae bacterium]